MIDREAQINEAAMRVKQATIGTEIAESTTGHAKINGKDKQPVAYYEADSGKFYLRNHRGEWIRFSESSLRRYLRTVTFADVLKAFGQDKIIDTHLVELQTKLDVTLAIPLAGYPPGVHEINGERVLVVKGANYVQPKQGDWSTIKRFVETLLPDQTDYLYGWLKASFRTLREGAPFRPGQLLAIAGPAGCGKSLLQNILTEMFGGRVAKPYKYMTGKTNFNSELFYAEHLAIEDEAASTLIHDRRTFGANIKNMLVNETQPYYRKAREALTLSPFWRVSCTLNDEPESLMVLPPLDSDLLDKIILLKASFAKFPFESDDIKSRKKFREQISRELPAFLAFLSSWRVPDRMKDQRYGIQAWQHPELMEALADLAPQSALLSLIDAIKPWDAFNAPFKGTAMQLKEILLEKDKHNRVNSLLKWNSACGAYLARLAKSNPDRVRLCGRPGNKAVWEILPEQVTLPSKEESTDEPQKEA